MRISCDLPIFFLLALFCLLRGALGQSTEASRVTAALGSGAAPIFDAQFATNPNTAATNWQWLQADPQDTNATVASFHQGLISLSGAMSSYMDLNVLGGSNGINQLLPMIGGAGSGSGVTQGWSLEVVVKLTGAVGGWAKIVDFGDGQIGNTTNDLMLTWDGNDNNETNLVPGLAAQQLSSPPPATNYNYASCPMVKPVLNQWYSIILVMQAVDVAQASATWFIYVNGQLLPYANNLQAGATFTAFQGANLPLRVPRNQSYLGRSDYNDSSLSAIYDAARVYDYALSPTQAYNLAGAYGLNMGVSLPQASNSVALTSTNETTFWQQAGIATAPVFNAVFPSDPSSVIGTQRLYSWSQTDSSDSSSVSAYHQGVITLTGGTNGFINLNTPTGGNSIGLVLGSFGGAGSGTGSTQGWTIEMVVKPTGKLAYSKLLTIGNGGYLDVSFFGWDAQGQQLYVEQTNNVNSNLPGTVTQTDITIPNSIPTGQWVHLAVVYQPTNLALFVGTMTVYVNGKQAAQQTGATYPVPTYKDECFIAASDYANDPNAQATYDAIRVYDTALTQQQLQNMAALYGLPGSSSAAFATAALSLPLMALLALLAFFSS